MSGKHGMDMKILFDDKFYESEYANDGASTPGRLEAVMTVLGTGYNFEIVRPQPASEEALRLAHTQAYVETIKSNVPLYDMAKLAAGSAIAAADIAVQGEPAFACVRPPGHHAYRDSAWGYCVFSNMGIALLQLKQQHKIESAFVLDFDAHTGDGTKDVLSNWKECIILNPYADNAQAYIREIQDFISGIPAVDVIGVCAGFDSYIKDVGRKLATFDFYTIGLLMKQFAQRAAQKRRFAILEGGYYLPDLGKNVLAFCQGFE
jgi:acetoin utilization deacetylase AcuC-like enzyme